MKAIIPVAGVGTRLRPLTYTQPKALIPIAGKPIMGYIIDQLVGAGINELIFVVGYFGDKVEDYVKNNYPKVKAHFVMQSVRQGIGDAVYQAKPIVKPKDELLIVLGDTIIDFDLKSVIKSKHSSLGIKKVDDPRDFGVVELSSKNDFILKVEEKPRIPKSNMALVGVYKIKESKQLFIALEHLITNDIRTKNEYQLTDALMIMIEKGIKFTGFQVGNWYDCGKREVLLETNAILLKKARKRKTSKFDNTIIVPPVSIPANCKIVNCIIGPNVTIGDHANLQHSIVKNSIIGSYTTIQDTLLNDSVVGGDAYIKGARQSLNIGDNTEIDFS